MTDELCIHDLDLGSPEWLKESERQRRKEIKKRGYLPGETYWEWVRRKNPKTKRCPAPVPCKGGERPCINSVQEGRVRCPAHRGSRRVYA